MTLNYKDIKAKYITKYPPGTCVLYDGNGVKFNDKIIGFQNGKYKVIFWYGPDKISTHLAKSDIITGSFTEDRWWINRYWTVANCDELEQKYK
jgi:hypothetical protein